MILFTDLTKYPIAKWFLLENYYLQIDYESYVSRALLLVCKVPGKQFKTQ